MADVRTFEFGSGEGIQKLVRDALGENVRPIEPGQAPATGAADDDAAPVSAADLPMTTGETIPFSW
ncbi:hypothetical protein [Tessaracoccus caeni]|uniref:hypothetical protein n=1 Tax=Tessaracoccus caeni TaxID=3031239 RepID=UPI0023D99CF7|nr:hypothetical protein [Tessaracoccus caeni]MDF1487637.1 hypothetical protein [Tessaracoccus caeni]